MYRRAASAFEMLAEVPEKEKHPVARREMLNQMEKIRNRKEQKRETDYFDE